MSGSPSAHQVLSGSVDAFVVYDLEVTAWEGSLARMWTGPDEFPEIVQIGAVKMTLQGAHEASVFDCLVKPRFYPVLSDYFIALTGISQVDVDSRGLAFEDALGEFFQFCSGLPMVAYGGDGILVRQNCEKYGVAPPFDTSQLIDIRPELCRRLGFAPDSKVSSGRLSQVLGFPGFGREHDALADARAVAAAIQTVRR